MISQFFIVASIVALAQDSIPIMDECDLRQADVVALGKLNLDPEELQAYLTAIDMICSANGDIVSTGGDDEASNETPLVATKTTENDEPIDGQSTGSGLSELVTAIISTAVPSGPPTALLATTPSPASTDEKARRAKKSAKPVKEIVKEITGMISNKMVDNEPVIPIYDDDVDAVLVGAGEIDGEVVFDTSDEPPMASMPPAEEDTPMAGSDDMVSNSDMPSDNEPVVSMVADTPVEVTSAPVVDVSVDDEPAASLRGASVPKAGESIFKAPSDSAMRSASPALAGMIAMALIYAA